MHKRGHPTHQRVFAEVAGRPGDYCHDEAVWIVAEMADDDDWPESVDLLERALDVCDWNGCGRERTHSWHGDPDAHEHDPKWSCHSFTPLVTP